MSFWWPTKTITMLDNENATASFACCAACAIEIFNALPGPDGTKRCILWLNCFVSVLEGGFCHETPWPWDDGSEIPLSHLSASLFTLNCTYMMMTRFPLRLFYSS